MLIDATSAQPTKAAIGSLESNQDVAVQSRVFGEFLTLKMSCYIL